MSRRSTAGPLHYGDGTGELLALSAWDRGYFDRIRPRVVLGTMATSELSVYPVSFADFVLGPFTAITATGTLTDRGVDQREAV